MRGGRFRRCGGICPWGFVCCICGPPDCQMHRCVVDARCHRNKTTHNKQPRQISRSRFSMNSFTCQCGPVFDAGLMSIRQSLEQTTMIYHTQRPWPLPHFPRPVHGSVGWHLEPAPMITVACECYYLGSSLPCDELDDTSGRFSRRARVYINLSLIHI